LKLDATERVRKQPIGGSVVDSEKEDRNTLGFEFARRDVRFGRMKVPIYSYPIKRCVHAVQLLIALE
jgi:hypothetical protein